VHVVGVEWWYIMKDKLLFLDKQKPLAESIAITALEIESNMPVIITISGLSGCGKSEIALLTADILNENNKHVKVLSLDSFYLPDHEEHRKETGYVGKMEIDWVRLGNSVSNLYFSRAFSHIIVEGLYANYYDTSDLRVFIDQGYKSSYGFRKERGKEDPDDEARKKVLRLEKEDVLPQKDKCDLILNY
jgi:ABC-type dipeptide/oligopeptide/nickel transport system ATPase component